MTPVQHALLAHTLGLNNRKKAFRNCFATGPGEDAFADVTALVRAGYMKAGGTIPGGLTYYHATAAGIAAAKLTTEELDALHAVFDATAPEDDDE